MEERKVDTGLLCLVMMAGYHGLGVDPEQLRHTLALGAEGNGDSEYPQSLIFQLDVEWDNRL